MTSLEAYTLLQRIAFNLEREKQVFNRSEIQKKINEIKYLSSQKKIPKITLRKEIIHLEHQLKRIDSLERQLQHQKLRDTKKYQLLKKENESLREKLATLGDQDLTQKINTISYAISDRLAMKETAQDVALSKVSATTEAPKESAPSRVELLQRRITLLKQELETSRVNKTMNSEKIRIIENQIDLLEAKLLRLTDVPKVKEMPETPPSWNIPEEKADKKDVKHDIIFQEMPPPKVVLSEEEKELPLPPPPKEMVKKA